MELAGELSRRELLVLKEIRLKGQTSDRTMVLQLVNDDLVVDLTDTPLQLTPKGRRMLVRGSPSLWDVAC
jgi:hypothetical protein